MAYVFTLIIGPIVGGTCVFLLLLHRERKVKKQREKLAAHRKKLEEAGRVQKRRNNELDRQEEVLEARQKELDSRAVKYEELQRENGVLKKDLHNIDVNLRKLTLDRDAQQREQVALDARSEELARRYLKENIKSISSSMTPNNYTRSKERLLKVVERCRGIGFEISEREAEEYLEDLKEEYEKVVRVAFEREEQARIKAQIREEQRMEREINKELKRLERERAAVQAALEKALAEAKDEHSVEVEQLKARLAEAEEKSKRVVSQAQLTKSGHVYVISNVGSFGKDVFKIGMTRRLEPEDRVRELSSASVPFPFDVHMMISCDDAPTLENTLHRALRGCVVNKANPRKEFFQTDIDTIAGLVEEHHGEVEYVADPEALEFRESLDMSEEDADFIESVYGLVLDADGQIPDME
jgi:hypothetical protein